MYNYLINFRPVLLGAPLQLGALSVRLVRLWVNPALSLNLSSLLRRHQIVCIETFYDVYLSLLPCLDCVGTCWCPSLIFAARRLGREGHAHQRTSYISHQPPVQAHLQLLYNVTMIVYQQLYMYIQLPVSWLQN